MVSEKIALVSALTETMMGRVVLVVNLRVLPSGLT